MNNLTRCLRLPGVILPEVWNKGVAAGIAALFALGICGPAFGEMTLKYSDHDPPGGMRTGFNKDVWLPEELCPNLVFEHLKESGVSG